MERGIKGNGTADLLTLHPFRGNPQPGVLPHLQDSTQGYQYVTALRLAFVRSQHSGKKQSAVSLHHFGIKEPIANSLSTRAARHYFDMHMTNANSLTIMLVTYKSRRVSGGMFIEKRMTKDQPSAVALTETLTDPFGRKKATSE